MHVSSTSAGRVPALFAYISAGIFIAASGSVNLLYGIGKGSNLATSAVWGAVSVAASITFALAWPALIRAAGAKSLSGVLIAIVALVLSGAYSISAALGSAGGSRMDASAQETAAAGARQRAQARYDAATAELAKLAPARPAAELEATIGRTPVKGRCGAENGTGRWICPTHPLAAELARARQRERLQATLDAASAELSVAGPARVANSDARTLARYMQAIGADISPERLNDLLTLLTVALVEMGGGLSLALGLTLSGAPASQPETTADAASGQARMPLANAADASIPNAQTVRSVNVRASVIEEWLQMQGGKTSIGMRGLGAALGCSPTKAHDEVRRAAAAGVLRATPGPRGTMLELANIN